MTNMKQPSNEELQNNNLNPEEGQLDTTTSEKEVKTYSEDEYKNLQAFSTRAAQEKIALAEKLVKANPKELETLDTKLQNKVIENLYGASSLDELKIISPELFEDKSSGGDMDVDELTRLQRKVELMEYKNNQGAVKSAIENKVLTNKDIVDTIPDFQKKMQEEMKMFSSELSIEEKADRAFKIITGNQSGNAAYLALQGKTIIKASEPRAEVKDEDTPFMKALKSQSRLRR